MRREKASLPGDVRRIRIIWKRQVAFVFAFFLITVIRRIDLMKEGVRRRLNFDNKFS